MPFPLPGQPKEEEEQGPALQHQQAAQPSPYPPGRANLSVQDLEVGPEAPTLQGGDTGPTYRWREPQQGSGIPQHPALGQPAQEIDQTDPEMKRRVLSDSAEAAKKASDDVKNKINAELEGAFGEGSIEKGYKGMLEQLGGEEEVGDLKLSKQDWGLFMMDFGLRLMAYSSQPGSTTGSSIGRAGADVVGNIQAHKQGIIAKTDERNEERRKTALAMAEHEQGRADKSSDEARDPQNILWTDKGAYNLRTGEYEKGPEGRPLRPGMAPGASNRPFAKQFMIDQLRQRGFSDDAATAMAQGASHPAEVAARAREELSDAVANGESIMVDGERIRARNLTTDQARRYVDEAVKIVQSYYGAEGPALKQPAPKQPGPAAEGRR